MTSITPVELHELVRQGRPVELIDVRTPAEYREVHAELAANVPLDALDPAAVLRDRRAPGGPLYFICKSGGRSQRACEEFAAAGFADVVNIEGGTMAWLDAGLPAVWGEPVAAAGDCGSSHCGCRSGRA